MLRSTLAISCTLCAVLAVLLMRECAFLFPLRLAIWQSCRREIFCFSLLLLFNLCAVVYQIVRRVTLSDTGDKLEHLEKQLRGRTTISKELSERILEQR